MSVLTGINLLIKDTIDYQTNFCGAYWSDGKLQPSVPYPTLPALSEFDETCREHDSENALATNNTQLRDSDLKFYNANINKGLKRTVAANLVYYFNPIMTRKGKNLRGGQQQGVPKATAKTATQNDKKMMAPVSIATKRTGAAPKINNKSNGVVEISHRSFLCPITSSANYSAQLFYVNPGLPGTFPWLSKLARRYEEYRFKKLKFEYRSVCATSTIGVVMMSFDYDAADAVPTNKAAQAQTVPNSEINSWSSNDLNISCDGGFKYIRPGSLQPNLDIKTYDFGAMCLSSLYGTNVVTGELYVEYTVELRKPTDGPATSGKISFSTVAFNSPFPVGFTTTGFNPFVPSAANTTELVVTVPGEYLITVNTVGTGLTAACPLPTLVTTTGAISSLALTFSATQGIHIFSIRAELGDVLQFATAGTGTTITALRIRSATANYDAM